MVPTLYWVVGVRRGRVENLMVDRVYVYRDRASMFHRAVDIRENAGITAAWGSWSIATGVRVTCMREEFVELRPGLGVWLDEQLPADEMLISAIDNHLEAFYSGMVYTDAVILKEKGD